MKDLLHIHELEELLNQREHDLKEKQEELESQRGMLSTAIEELIKNNQILKERNEELQRLLYQSSHSLRSPISSIQGLINLLHLEELNSNSKEYLAYIEKKTNKMIDVLNALNSLSVVSYDEIKLELISIDHIIEENIKSALARAKKNQVTIDYSNPGSEVRVYSNYNLLSEALRQLINNGLIFRDTTMPGFLNISAHLNSENVVIQISDDGEGIDATIAPHIFEMFYRGSEKSGGTGLGLFIVKKALELLDGRIEFTTTSSGSTFSVYLPNNFNTSSTESAY